MTAAMLALLQTGDARSIADIFGAMDVAERAIAAARIPRAKQGNLFSLLLPPAPMRGLAPAVYASHVAELCVRWKRRADMRLATGTEMMIALSEASLRAPLEPNALAAYEVLFGRVMGRKAARKVRARVDPQGSWPGAVEELLAQLAKQAQSPDRVRETT